MCPLEKGCPYRGGPHNWSTTDLVSDEWVHKVVIWTEDDICLLCNAPGGKVGTRLGGVAAVSKIIMTSLCHDTPHPPSLSFPSGPGLQCPTLRSFPADGVGLETPA